MASPDNVILLVVDYHAAIEGKSLVPPPLRTSLLLDADFSWHSRIEAITSKATNRLYF